MFRREPVAWVALFLALSGTAIAARPLVFKEGAVRSVDVRDGSLKRIDARRGVGTRGARGPQGPAGAAGPVGATGAAPPPTDRHLTSAVINADGTVRRADTLTSGDVRHPETGVYCVVLADVEWVRASSADLTDSRTIGVDRADCAGDLRVTIRTGIVLTDAPFQLVVAR